MLRKISTVHTKPGEPRKLWFNSQEVDLFLWISERDEVIRFQLSYDKPNSEKSLVWDHQQGVEHAVVDDGSRPGKHPSAPILLGETSFDKNKLFNLLDEHGGELPDKYLRFIQAIICNKDKSDV